MDKRFEDGWMDGATLSTLPVVGVILRNAIGWFRGDNVQVPEDGRPAVSCNQPRISFHSIDKLVKTLFLCNFIGQKIPREINKSPMLSVLECANDPKRCVKKQRLKENYGKKLRRMRALKSLN